MPDLDFSTIRPHAVYTTREVAELLRVTNGTVLGWIERGTLPALPRMFPRARYRILGAAILALTGVQAPTAESPAARSKRAAADREAIRRMKQQETPACPR